METIRSWIGIGSAPAPNTTSAHEKQAQERSKALVQAAASNISSATDAERLEKLARAQTIQLDQKMDQLKEVEQELDQIDPQTQRDRTLQLIQTKKQCAIEAKALSQKLQNTRNQQKILDQARMNLEQQAALKESAVELKALALASEELNVQEAVDVIQDAVKDLKHQDKLLTKPIFGSTGGSTLVDQDEAEQELAALLARKSLPSVPISGVAAAAAAAATTATEKPTVAEEKVPTAEK